MRVSSPWSPWGLGLLAIAALPLAARGDVGDFRAKVEKWVETRQILSKERADWQVEQQSLRDTRNLLRQEKKALQAEIAELEASNTASDEERRDLLLERGELQRADRALEDEIRAMETQVLALVPRLPEPLQKKLEPLLVQIPDDSENGGSTVPLGQRLMNVLGVLAQAERWNGTATFVAETRAVAEGEPKVQVRTLYWGLGEAVYVDTQGRIAGIGRPSSDASTSSSASPASGWRFVSHPELADRARQLLDIYEGNVDAIEFVEVPVEIH